jgi:hypothetical protein
LAKPPDFGSGSRGFDSCLPSSALIKQPNSAPVAQLEEALVLETRRCRYPPGSKLQILPGVLSGCSADGSASGLGPEGRRFDPCHSDSWVANSIGWSNCLLSSRFRVQVSGDPPCPCDAIGRHDLLKTGLLQVQVLSGVLAEMELWCALGSHKPSHTGYSSRSKLQIPAPLPTYGSVA